MRLSAAMISRLRSCRSAHTPPNTDTTACGRKPNTIAAVSTRPDFVSSVRCHRIAYCTRDEPNSEIGLPGEELDRVADPAGIDGRSTPSGSPPTPWPSTSTGSPLHPSTLRTTGRIRQRPGRRPRGAGQDRLDLRPRPAAPLASAPSAHLSIGAVVNDVLDSPEFGAILQKLADESGKPVAALREEAEADLKEMAVRPGKWSGAAWDSFCGWLSRAYRVDYRPAEVERLRELNRSASLVFLPNHRSYLDPMILRSALSQHGFAPNNVLGGANLAIWPFSEIGQRNGIVFIRREFRDDHVYRATLRAYLSHLIEERKNLEWYIEGGRTRTGKLRPPRLGILSYVMDAYGEHPERDVLIIPTSIIYDQQHEVGAISAEEMGGTKKPESIKWMYEFATSQSRRLGRAYLRFGEPLSLGDAVALTADEDGHPAPAPGGAEGGLRERQPDQRRHADHPGRADHVRPAGQRRPLDHRRGGPPDPRAAGRPTSSAASCP